LFIGVSLMSVEYDRAKQLTTIMATSNNSLFQRFSSWG